MSVTVTPRVIGLVGGIEAGKDTVGALLSMIGYQRLSFGDLVKGEVLYFMLMERPVKPVEMGMSLWKSLCIEYQMHSYSSSRLKNAHKAVYGKPTGPVMRELLQWWGTDYRRAINQNYWVDQAMGQVNDSGKLVITDVRFENEADFVYRRGGMIWGITNPSRLVTAADSHISEKIIETIIPDSVILNDGSIYDLAIAVRKQMASYSATKAPRLSDVTEELLNNFDWTKE